MTGAAALWGASDDVWVVADGWDDATKRVLGVEMGLRSSGAVDMSDCMATEGAPA